MARLMAGLKLDQSRLHGFVWGGACLLTLLPATTHDYGKARHSAKTKTSCPRPPAPCRKELCR